jgi:hypothetical protein
VHPWHIPITGAHKQGGCVVEQEQGTPHTHTQTAHLLLLCCCVAPNALHTLPPHLASLPALPKGVALQLRCSSPPPTFLAAVWCAIMVMRKAVVKDDDGRVG